MSFYLIRLCIVIVCISEWGEVLKNGNVNTYKYYLIERAFNI